MFREMPVLPQPSVNVVQAAPDSPTYYNAFWRHPMPDGKRKPVKRRVGKAWVERDGEGWKKRAGRTPEGWLDPRTVHAAASALVTAYQDELDAKATEAAQGDRVTFRQAAWECHGWKKRVKGASPASSKNEESYLREAGSKRSKHGAASKGWIMMWFGDVPIDEIDFERCHDFLNWLETEHDVSPRSVNAYREIVGAILTWCQRRDAHNLPGPNPMLQVESRTLPVRDDEDFYEVEEAEAIARALAEGKHRKPRVQRGRQERQSEQAARVQQLQDLRDATAVIFAFYSAMRFGQIRAVRWKRVTFELDGALIRASRKISAGVDMPGSKSGKKQTVPLAKPAAQALARWETAWPELMGREPKPDDYVFPGDRGDLLGMGALRDRYKAAAEAIGVRYIRPHGLRHAGGSHVGGEASAVFTRDFMGHSRLQTTDRYTHTKMAKEGIAIVNRAFGVDTDGPQPVAEKEPA